MEQEKLIQILNNFSIGYYGAEEGMSYVIEKGDFERLANEILKQFTLKQNQ